MRNQALLLAVALFAASTTFAQTPASPVTSTNTTAPLLPRIAWAKITKETKPGTRWWWMGSAVNPVELENELKTFKAAGLGTVEITPIYGVKGYESQFIEYLSPTWMKMLKTTVTEAQKLDMNVDMVTGTGWCFGGTNVSDQDANALAIYSDDGRVSQKPSGVVVKRPAPGGAGWMLNPLYPAAMSRYLKRFTDAFATYTGPKVHGQFHDSYEYKSDWSPDFFDQFEKRRGYKLQNELPALFKDQGDPDHVARVKGDYRETVSDLIVAYIGRWTQWSHAIGGLSRDQAHGSPGNWLDIYAASDVPETEMFNRDRDILVSKFASSAADVTGKHMVSSETGTWLDEHFTETLADLKCLFDDMYLSGVNRIMYHGTTYSPPEAEWPGWCFYASTEMNPRNAIWHDLPALNSYATRVQGLLQNSAPDNDILLYWPIHDLWHNPQGMVQQMSVHVRDWFHGQSIGKAAKSLWDRGYTFDYISDRQLGKATVSDGHLDLFGNNYRVVVVPSCVHLPVETLKKLLSLAASGVTIIVEDQLPTDVPGAADLEKRRVELQTLLKSIVLSAPTDHGVRRATIGKGQVLVGSLEGALQQAGVRPEELAKQSGIHFVRRVMDNGTLYFIANRGTQHLDQEIALSKPFSQAALLDPMTGVIRRAETTSENGEARVRLQLEPGGSILLRTLSSGSTALPPWHYWNPAGSPIPIPGTWEVKFLEGGPVLPKSYTTGTLGSWTDSGGAEVKTFSGTALYTLHFDAPTGSDSQRWSLDLGKVVQSARVRLNGRDLGTLFLPPYCLSVDHLKPRDNLLEVEVTSTSANRIRDLDVRGVKWKIFYDANVNSINDKPFDASQWPVAEAGLIGPVTLQPQN